MKREQLIELFDKNKEDLSKYEKNKKTIREINKMIDKLKKNTDTKITTTYKEISSGATNSISNTIQDCVEKKEERIKELEEENKRKDMFLKMAKEVIENSILKQKIRDKLEELKKEYIKELEKNSTKAFILKCQISVIEELLKEV